MSDTQSIREVIEETSQEVETPVVEEAKVETPEASQPQEVVAEEQPEVVEKFAEDKDLSGLSPEQLLETKREWERAYTKKRQAETAELKKLREEIEQFRKQQTVSEPAPVVDFSQQKAQVNELYRNGQLDYQTAIAKLEEINREEARQVAREEFEAIQTEAQLREEHTRQEQFWSEFLSVDTRLDEHSPTPDKTLLSEVQGKLADALDLHIQNHGSSAGFDVKGLTQQFVQEYDQRIDELVKQRTKQSVQAAKMRDAKIQKSASRGTTTESTSVGGNSVRDILSQTVDELGA